MILCWDEQGFVLALWRNRVLTRKRIEHLDTKKMMISHLEEQGFVLLLCMNQVDHRV
jgi:hypothetical protein